MFRMKRNISLAFIILLFASTVSGQSMGGPKNLIKNGKFALLLGYNYNKGHWGEIGIVRGFRYNYLGPPQMPAAEIIYPYASLSSELLIKDKYILCPKLGYHFVLGFVDIGINAFDYTDFHQHNFGIRPEVGLTLTGLFGVYYGYNIKTNNNFDILGHHFGAKAIIGSGLFMDNEKREKRLKRKNRS